MQWYIQITVTVKSNELGARVHLDALNRSGILCDIVLPHCHAFLCLTTSLPLSLHSADLIARTFSTLMLLQWGSIWQSTNCTLLSRGVTVPIEWEATCPWLCSICAQWLDQLFRGEWSLVQCLPSLYLTWRFFLYFHLSLATPQSSRIFYRAFVFTKTQRRVYGLYYIDRTKVRSPREKSQWSLAKQQSAREQSYVHGMYDMNTK